MVPAQIEKEILIEAPVEVVWRMLTEPEHMKVWFATEVELDGRAGGEGNLSFAHHGDYHLQVEAFDPPRRFAYRWMHERGTRARAGNSMLVEFTLHPEAGKTRLRLVESGFDEIDWADDAKSRYADDHANGWSRFLELLRDYALRANAAAPQ